jgi:hypothetical protein
MAVRSTTARRLATVIVATAAVSAVGTGAASAATSPAPTSFPATSTPQVVVPPLSLPQVGLLLNNLLGTVDGLLGTQLVASTPLTESNKNKPLLRKTVDNLTGTTKELPVVGGVVGGLTDGLGLSEPTKTASHPSTPATAVPSTPAKHTGKHRRVVDSVAPGSTWTAPMVEAPQLAPVTHEDHGSLGRIPNILREVGSLLPANAAEAAAAGAGAATVALIVLGGIAVTGAAGAASAAGRRGLINGSVGGSL